jgi:hypothetical protein
MSRYIQVFINNNKILYILALASILFAPIGNAGEKSMSETQSQTNTKKYTYWLEVSANNVLLEYGLNDRMAFDDNEGGNHYFEAPADGLLKRGENTAYVRFKTPAPQPSSSEMPSNSGESEPPTYIKLAIQALNIETQEQVRVELVTLTINPITGEVKPNLGSGSNIFPLQASPDIRVLRELVANPIQGKEAGYRISFLVKDEFPIPHHTEGHEIQITDKLPGQIQQAMQQLLHLYQQRNYNTLVNAYNYSWLHMALSFDYGLTGKDFADAMDFMSDLQNPNYEFFLDFSQSKLRLEANGKLVGFYPTPLKAREPDGFVAIDFPVFFMLEEGVGLKIGG